VAETRYFNTGQSKKFVRVAQLRCMVTQLRNSYPQRRNFLCNESEIVASYLFNVKDSRRNMARNRNATDTFRQRNFLLVSST
jgi:hypothetical protein